MDCVRAQQLVRPYLDGYLSDRELQEFLDHVETCRDCFEELELYFLIYRTLDDVDEKGDYNFTKKLRKKLEASRAYLRRRYQGKALKTLLIAAAEFVVVCAFWGLLYLPGGYIDRHRTETLTAETVTAQTVSDAEDAAASAETTLETGDAAAAQKTAPQMSEADEVLAGAVQASGE